MGRGGLHQSTNGICVRKHCSCDSDSSCKTFKKRKGLDKIIQSSNGRPLVLSFIPHCCPQLIFNHHCLPPHITTFPVLVHHQLYHFLHLLPIQATVQPSCQLHTHTHLLYQHFGVIGLLTGQRPCYDWHTLTQAFQH